MRKAKNGKNYTEYCVVDAGQKNISRAAPPCNESENRSRMGQADGSGPKDLPGAATRGILPFSDRRPIADYDGWGEGSAPRAKGRH